MGCTQAGWFGGAAVYLWTSGYSIELGQGRGSESRLLAREDIGDVVSNTGGMAKQHEEHSGDISTEWDCLEHKIVSLARFICAWWKWVGAFLRLVNS